MLETLILVLHVLVAIGIIVLVLLQHGRGADMGAAFGSGSSGSLFGSAGSANFLSRTTAVLATVFFVSSVALTYFGSTRGASIGGGVIKPTTAPAAPSAPAGAKLPSDIPTAPGGAGAAGGASTPAPAADGSAGQGAATAPPGSKAADVPK